MYGNISELGDIGIGPGKSSLFFLTAQNLEIRLPGEKVYELGKHSISVVSGALSTILENLRERLHFHPWSYS